MPILSYKYRLYPTRKQHETLQWTLDRCRELYNASLQERKEAWKYEKKSIPYTTQLTNPDQVHGGSSTADPSVVIPQAEPNGLYTGTSSATWVLCIRSLPGGGSEIDPVYSEPDAIAFPYPVQLSADGSVQDAGGSSSVQINVKQK